MSTTQMKYILIGKKSGRVYFSSNDSKAVLTYLNDACDQLSDGRRRRRLMRINSPLLAGEGLKLADIAN